ncbi:MAG: hypothetical protein H6718_08980 [Polyangiaceae bacterium]|nr:hypothetical protein [Myxococcales bacterium]MCB9585519.1 hypothetical protein [Polyangiaceae bacterium]MCB9606465.1 hypothetical protein [Polyangiaceae bacterium]
MIRRIWMPALALGLALGLGGCDEGPSKNAAPVSSSLEPAAKPTEASAFDVKTDASKVTFLMDAPIEKIFGDAPGSASGEFYVDLHDVTKSTGLVKIDLEKLVVYQQKRENENAEFGEKVKSDTQNEHVMNWLEIGKDAPDAEKAKNRYIEFKVKKVETDGEKDITKLSGAERKLDLTVTGDFRLHQRTVEKTAKLELTVKYEGDKPTQLLIKSKEAIPVDMEKHDVRPREAFGKLAQATFDTLSKKVNKMPQVSLELEATPK